LAYAKHYLNAGGHSAAIENERHMGYLAVVFLAGVVVFLFFIGGKSGKTSGTESAQAKELELTERFRMGSYVQGLPGQQEPEEVVSCAVTERDFIVCKGVLGAEIGRIARNSINDIRLSKEGTTSYLLELSWVESSAIQHKAVFCFDDKRLAESMANGAVELLGKWKSVEQGQAAAGNA
jgi:hypothetical protein